MEEQWYVDRCTLRDLHREHANWSQGELAQAVGRSHSWVKKWLGRLGKAVPDDERGRFRQQMAAALSSRKTNKRMAGAACVRLPSLATGSGGQMFVIC